MAGKAVFPAKIFFVRLDKVRDALVVDGLCGISFLWEEPVSGTQARGTGIPITENQLPGLLRELGVARRTVFGGTDKDPAPGVFNIGTF